MGWIVGAIIAGVFGAYILIKVVEVITKGHSRRFSTVFIILSYFIL